MAKGLPRLLVAICLAAPLAAQAHWPQWRGPLGTGAAPEADPPTTWSETKNVRLKIELPGSGQGTPIVWGNRIFITTAIAFGKRVDPVPDNAPGAHDNAAVTQHHEFAALCIDRRDGKVLWQRTLHKQLPHAVFHKTGTLASASPVTDGEHVFAFFGSYGLYCLDMSGKLLWQKDLGDMQVKHGHGEGGSPALFGDTLVVNWDHEGQSFLVAFDKRTGKERWRVDRDEVTSWSTPIVVAHGDGHQVIVSGTKRLRGYDLATGKVIWECAGLSHNIVASPVSADGMVYAGSSYEKRRMFAIRLEGAKGDITATDSVVWRRQRSTPYVPSPLLYGDWLYFLNHYQGFLCCVEAKTGKQPAKPLRLAGMREIYASPVGAGGRVYITDRDGNTVVLSHGGGTPKVLAENRLEDSFSASAAIVGDEIYLRGSRYLYCIARDKTGKPESRPDSRPESRRHDR